MIKQLQVQQFIKDFCDLSHLLFISGQARDELKVSVDDPANSGGTADSKNNLSPDFLRASCCMVNSLDLEGNEIFDSLNPVLIPLKLTVGW